MKTTWATTILMLSVAAAVRAELAGEARLQFADGLFARGMHALALREYEGYVQSGSTGRLDVAYFRLGESYRAVGRVAEAEVAYRRIDEAFPDSAYRHKANYKRAILFREAGAATNAVRLLEGVLAGDPPAEVVAPALYLLGEAQEDAGNPDAAIGAYARLAALPERSPFHVYAQLCLGRLYGASPERHPQAMEAFAWAQREAPTDRLKAEALFQLAELHYGRGDFTASAPLFLRLIEAFPEDERIGDARLRGAWAAHHAGRHADALILADRGVTEGDGRLQDWWYIKANCERQLGRLQAASASYRRLLKAFPEGRFADAVWYELALTYYRDRAFEQAVEAAGHIALSASNRRDVYWLLAQGYAALGRRDQAVQYFRLLVTEYPEADIGAEAAYRLGFYLQEGDDLAGAAEAYALVASRFPGSGLAPRALFAAGLALARLDRHAEAVEAWTALVRRYADDALAVEARYRQALSEIQLARDDDALRTLRELLRGAGTSPFVADAHFWEGVLLERAGQFHDAGLALRRALAATPRDGLARQARLRLGVVLYREKQYGEAAELFQGVLQTPLEAELTPDLLYWLAGYQQAAGDAGAAVLAAERLLALHALPVWQQAGQLVMGKGLLAQGDAAGAERAFALAVAPGGGTREAAEAALLLGDLLLARGAFEDARGRYEETANWAGGEEDPGLRARAYAGLGRAALGLGQDEAAVRYFMSVAVLYDDAVLVPECLGAAAAILERLGRAGEAAKVRAELKQRYPDAASTTVEGKLPTGGKEAATP